MVWRVPEVPMVCRFVPPYLLRRLAIDPPDPHVGTSCQSTLRVDHDFRSRRAEARGTRPPSPEATTATRVIHTANNTETLPGTVARRDGQPPTGDIAVDEAFPPLRRRGTCSPTSSTGGRLTARAAPCR
jgi:hypothetical protein